MKITGLRTFHVLPRWLLVAIDTDRGSTGWGEAVVEGQARVVEQLLRDLAEYLIGQDPRRIEHHWQVMYRGAFYRGGPVLCSAISGIDQALWDITGKSLDAPVHALLGGAVRDRIRMYGHARGRQDQDFVDAAVKAQSEGMTAIKFGIDGPVAMVDSPEYVDRQVRRVQAVREARRSPVRHRVGLPRSYDARHGASPVCGAGTVRPDVHRGTGAPGEC